MATLYWGPSGGTATGTWDASTTTNWFTDAARTVSAPAAPTSADDVVFDADSDAGINFTVTIGTGAVCRDITVGTLDVQMTYAGSASWSIYGSLSFPASGLVRTFTGTTYFYGTGTHTINLNGVPLLTTGHAIFQGTGSYTLQSAFACATATARYLAIYGGTFDTAGFTVSALSFRGFGTVARTIYLRSSTINLSTGLDFVPSTNLTLDSGTSTINFSTTPLVELDLTLNNVVCNAAGLTFSYGGLIRNLTMSVLPATITLGTGGMTLAQDSIGGTAGGQLSFVSAAAPAQATLIKIGGPFTFNNSTLANINAVGGASWYAFTDDGNVDAGNNDGINFQDFGLYSKLRFCVPV